MSKRKEASSLTSATGTQPKRVRHLDGSEIPSPVVSRIEGSVGVLVEDDSEDDDERMQIGGGGDETDRTGDASTCTPSLPVASPSTSSRVQLLFRRAMVTESMFRALRKPGPLHSRVEAYLTHMREDRLRTDGPLLDINRRDCNDGNKTLLMKAISLFGEICGNHRAGSPEPVSYPSMDGQGAKEHLSHLMDELDVNLKEDRGLDSLGYLVNNSQARVVINAQVYFDWWVVTKLMALSAHLESLSPKGETPLLHCASSGSTPNVLQLLIAHGADIGAVDKNGNNMWHKLVTSGNYRVIDALTKDNTMMRALGSWLQPNNADQTPLQLARQSRHGSHLANSIYRLMKSADSMWSTLVAPLILSELSAVMQVGDLAQMTLEYLDGSGPSWVAAAPTPPPEKVERVEEEGVQSLSPGHSPTISHAAPAPAVNPADLIDAEGAADSGDDEEEVLEDIEEDEDEDDEDEFKEDEEDEEEEEEADAEGELDDAGEDGEGSDASLPSEAVVAAPAAVPVEPSPNPGFIVINNLSGPIATPTPAQTSTQTPAVSVALTVTHHVASPSSPGTVHAAGAQATDAHE